MTAPPGEMTPEEQRVARITLVHLQLYVAAASAFFAEARDRPRPGSALASLMADKDLMQPVYLAGMYLEVARDHFGSVMWAFTPPAEVARYSVYTLVRGALEADAWACWLLDPGLSSTERLARSLTLRALDLREVRRLDVADEDSEWSYEDRVSAIEVTAARHHLQAQRNKHGEVFAVGARKPEMVALLDELLPEPYTGPNAQPLGSRSYGLLSARAHGNPWAVLHNVKRAGRLGPHVAVAEVEVDVLEFMRLLRVALRLHSEAMNRTALLNGQDPSDWEKLRGPTAESRLAK